MSQYPHPYGYGQHHGQPPLQPYTYPNAPSYPVPGHVTPYNPSVTPVHRDVSQAAYDMNATHIPGLGIGGTAPVESYGSFESGVSSWNQPAGLPVPTPHAPQQQVYGRNTFEAGSSQPGASNSSRSDAPSNQAAIEAPRPSAIVEMEEGELSEGQFEDLYEPREDASDAPVKPVNKTFPLPVGESSQLASAADTPDGGFYGTDEDDGGKDARGNEGRERSASYSPFLSPREVQSEIPTPQAAMDKEAQSTPAEPVVETQSLASPNRQVSTQAPPAASTSNGSSNIGGSAVQSQGDPFSSFKSLQEAKKEAQKAILRLWPLGVKYQNYIEEGFDEKLIKGLFLDLHLDMPKAAAGSPAATSRATQPQQGGGTDQSKPSQPSSKQPQAPPSTKDSASMSEQSRKGEERKDRIARLLAAKAAKAPAAPNPPKPAPTPSEKTVLESQAQGPAPAAQTSAPSRSKTWGEKERLLQQKIAALQKAREARKAAEGTTGTGTTQGGSGEETTMSQGISAGSSTSPSIPTAPKAFNGSQKSADTQTASSQAIPSQPRSPLPGLALTSNGLQNTSNQRKRPVALDFVDYSSGQGVSKRPFVQTRQETSLIIDVSDGSDDEDMEMDMDIGSPVEETLSSQSAGISGQHGPAIRDFPPLTDTFPKRQLSSPAPSVTPPGGRVTSTKRTTELDLKEKAIQDMRRKIALAEAKRKAKQSAGGSVTPNRPEQGIKGSKGTQPPPTQTAEFMSSQDGSDRSSSGFTPEPSSAYAHASSEAHLDPLQRGDHRGHMSSENPRVESSLTEKMKRLQQLQDEQERLKAELERSIAEQKRLAAELQQFDTTSPSTETAGPNGSNSESQPVQPVSTLEAPSEQQGEGCSTQPRRTTVDVQGRRSPSPQTVSGRGNDEAPSEVGSFHKRREEGPSLDADNDIVGRIPDASADHSLETPAVSALFLPKSDAMAQEAARDVLIPSPNPESAKSNSSAAHGLGQMGSSNADETTPMELESQSPSPEAVEHTSSVNAESPTPLPDQISGSAQPREPAQEIEAEVAGEVQVVSSSSAGTLGLTQQQVQDRPESKAHSKLKPYQSPLRYFHAYRFHPEYQNTVAGGLRSLTYSNRIDPERELCPFELTGEQCPTNCEYQHFRTISAPDDQILLELGNSEDLSVEQKSGFIQGLRDLLQKFKADKVRDFDTIARGIVEFRTRFLGDKSKVLRLEGVTI